MRKTASIMGMPVSVTIVDAHARESDIDDVFEYFHEVDRTFSTYKDDSEIQRINRAELAVRDASAEVQHVLDLCEQTKRETDGYFDIRRDAGIDPSGLVKGYAIFKAAGRLREKGFRNFLVDIGGDVEVSGTNEQGTPWRIGIKNPFRQDEIVKVVQLSEGGVATSGTYIRGHHIYDPHRHAPASDIASITVIGPNIYEADRFATAAFAMGIKGIEWIEQRSGIEGYLITHDKHAFMTSGFSRYLPVHHHADVLAR